MSEATPLPAPDPETASTQQIEDYINNLRARAAEDREGVSEEELAHGILCLRQLRAGAVSRSRSKKTTAPSVKAFTLDDF